MAKRKPAAAKAAPKKPSSSDKSYTVLARRYRPQQFDELIGQEPVAKALVNALESNRVAHAYLFTGARGVGKTSCARILAKALNCEQGPTKQPCDACDKCQSIASGEDVDVLEIDGASNRGIDEVREIRQNVQYRPSRSQYKIYIIDEVHMLTAAAFNALLKTLEEPPGHVKFIFATTEPQRIPITILSRCQRFDFTGIGMAKIVERLRQVVESEGMKADEEALELVARRAGGSMRDAQSLLDQLLAFGTDQLSSDQVHSLLGTAPADRVAGLAAAVAEKNVKQALELVDREVQEGRQLGELVDQLIDYWRDLMVCRAAGSDAPDLSVSSGQRQALAQQAESIPVDTILAGLDILTTTKVRLRGSFHGRVLLEMALVRLCRLEDLVSVSALANLIGQSPPVQKTERKGDGPARPFSPPVKSLAASIAAAENPLPDKPTELAKPEPLTSETLAQLWPSILGELGGMRGNAIAKAGIPAISGPNTLVFQFPAEYNAQRELCQDGTFLEKIEAILRTKTGQSWSVRIASDGGGQPLTASSQQPEAGQQPSADNNQEIPRSRQRHEEAVRVPLVKRAMDRMDAQIIQADAGFGSNE